MFVLKHGFFFRNLKCIIHCMHASVADPQCVSAANSSAQWLKENFGFFSRFASVLDFYKLHRNFSGVNENQPLDFNTLTPNSHQSSASPPLTTNIFPFCFLCSWRFFLS